MTGMNEARDSDERCSLAAGIRVVELASSQCEPVRMATRLLADMGATVIVVEETPFDLNTRRAFGDDRTRQGVPRDTTWDHGKTWLPAGSDEDAARDALAEADLVFDGNVHLAEWGLPAELGVVWVSITPFGQSGPRADWLGSDLTCLAASGYMFATGEPGRAPLRATASESYAHVAAEAVVAAMTALASGSPQHVDVSVQETMQASLMSAAASFPEYRRRGTRNGVYVGRTPDIWRCSDGFVVFGMRGGPQRARTWGVLGDLAERKGIDPELLRSRDWSTFDHSRAPEEDLHELIAVLSELFAQCSAEEIYALGLEHRVLLAPVWSPQQILASRQLEARGLWGEVDGARAPSRPPFLTTSRGSDAAATQPILAPTPSAAPAWNGLRIVEFASGIAGPMLTRYFVEHGATCIHIESTIRPDVIRLAGVYPYDSAMPPLEASEFFANSNAGKWSVSLDLKDPRGREIAIRLAGWADLVVDNYAPGTIRRLGIDYDELAAHRPELVTVSSSIWGATGPESDYPGYGAQGSALSGYTFLTGWPGGLPTPQFGALTDALAPRYGAAGVAAALLRARRTGVGAHLDVSQVETGVYTLGPALRAVVTGVGATRRNGNRNEGAVPHLVAPCRGDDQWVAVAVWGDAAWREFCRMAGFPEAWHDWDAVARQTQVDEVEAAVIAWTRVQRPDDVAARLQAIGVDAHPVADFADIYHDDQLAARGHYVPLVHPILGTHAYERSGFRLSSHQGVLSTPGPVLGEHTDRVLTELLDIGPEQLAQLHADGVLR